MGEELVPNLDQAILELVRNAYDADATICTVVLDGVSKPGGNITVSDDGTGMTAADIVDGWLVLGGSRKSSDKPTLKKGRRTVGDKGLGRIAALRAGANVRVLTMKENESSATALEIDWARYDSAAVVEDVELELKQGERNSFGTEIVISGLKKAITKAEVDRLGRSLVLLTSPFEEGSEFRVELTAAEFPSLEARVKNSYLDDAEFVLKAELRADGTAYAIVKDWKGQELYSAESTDWLTNKSSSEASYAAPSAVFELYVYILDRKNFTGRGATIAEVKSWLNSIGGVHFYHRGFRVPPYGDPGHDWLDMNLSRARSPEERPSTNTSVGRVIVADPKGKLTQKTDRVGFIDSGEFQEIRRFAKDALEWFARQRLRAAEARRENQRRTEKDTFSEPKKEIEDVINQSVPKADQERVKLAIEMLEKRFESTLRATRDDLILYRSLATAGTTAAVFAHEIGKPITAIRSSQKSIRRRASNLKPKRDVDKLKSPLDIILSSSERLMRFASMQIEFLKREKRRHGAIDLNSVITSIHEIWQPVLADAKIKLELEHHAMDSAVLYGAEALVETIITNCITNSVSAFEQEGARQTGRKIVLKVSVEGSTVAVEIRDNGPGIAMDLKDIWLPGRTTRNEGTGFGLTIAKDSTLDLGGKHQATTSADGAVFRFVFPLASG
ncbi:ATP-binding protein [Xanthomonas sacchari]|nr:ATP-binding protein [Xanthomonas sacchari]